MDGSRTVGCVCACERASALPRPPPPPTPRQPRVHTTRWPGWRGARVAPGAFPRGRSTREHVSLIVFFLSHLEQTSRSQPFKTSYMTVFVKKNFFQYSSFWDCAKRIVSYDKLILKFFLFISKRKLLIKLYESKEAKQLRVNRCYWIIFTDNQITLHCSITTIKMK